MSGSSRAVVGGRAKELSYVFVFLFVFLILFCLMPIFFFCVVFLLPAEIFRFDGLLALFIFRLCV